MISWPNVFDDSLKRSIYCQLVHFISLQVHFLIGNHENDVIQIQIVDQVDFMRVQLRRAKGRTDTQDIELAMDMMVVLSKNDHRNADIAIIERLAKKLDLHTVEELKNETIAIRNLVKERGGQVHNSESLEQIVDLLNKFKEIIGMEITDVFGNPAMTRTLEKCASLVIPHEFLCPITLEIMTDPVIIASGQVITHSKWEHFVH